MGDGLQDRPRGRISGSFAKLEGVSTSESDDDQRELEISCFHQKRYQHRGLHFQGMIQEGTLGLPGRGDRERFQVAYVRAVGQTSSDGAIADQSRIRLPCRAATGCSRKKAARQLEPVGREGEEQLAVGFDLSEAAFLRVRVDDTSMDLPFAFPEKVRLRAPVGRQ